MSKSVLISIRPRWCELIASGKKTIEVRKTCPKPCTPFKCYIYCTKPKKILRYVFGPEDYEGMFPPEQISDKKVFCKVPDGSSPFCSEVNGNGKVIGEFMCDQIAYTMNCITGEWFLDILVASQLTAKELDEYSVGKRIYGWHIANLVIYDKPKELAEFGIKRAPQSWCYVSEARG